MRALTLSACLVLLAAADGSALAASGCGKGMLWPYVRQPGDCLTDDEIKAGQRGVYNGPINTNPDMSNVKIETPPAASTITGSSGPAPSSAAASGSAPVAASAGRPLFGGGVMEQNANGPSMNGPGFSFAPAQRVSDAACSKGWLWPFVRNPGDCLTDAEKGNGQTGVYRADQVVASASPAAGPAATQVSAPGAATPAGTTATQTASAEPACRKGWLWPFVRKPGDCPTDAERRGR
jgi:hypothetical protein